MRSMVHSSGFWRVSSPKNVSCLSKSSPYIARKTSLAQEFNIVMSRRQANGVKQTIDTTVAQQGARYHNYPRLCLRRVHRGRNSKNQPKQSVPSPIMQKINDARVRNVETQRVPHWSHGNPSTISIIYSHDRSFFRVPFLELSITSRPRCIVNCRTPALNHSMRKELKVRISMIVWSDHSMGGRLLPIWGTVLGEGR